jgi:hypothetical protein
MKKNGMLAWLGVIAVAIVFAGCAKEPQAEIAAARAALFTADSLEADLYVSDLYQAAQDSFAAAQAEIQVQNARSSLARDYNRAAQQLQFVAQSAAMAQEQVAARKEELRVQTDTLIAQTKWAVAEARALLAKAPRGKDGNVALVAIQEDAGTAETMLNDAIQAQAEGKVAQAHDLARSALSRANSLVEEMNQAIAKTGVPRS